VTMTASILRERLDLADTLLAGRRSMLEPQDLPGRYGRVVHAIDRVLQATNGQAVLAGGWAVWRHGYVGRVTQDIDIALAVTAIDEFLRVAGVAGFDVLTIPPGHWPKLHHRDTGIQVDLLPEGATPGTATRRAPTNIPHPDRMGASGSQLRYIDLPSLIELKLAAARIKDDADVVELIRANAEAVEQIRTHLLTVHADYVVRFDELAAHVKDDELR
jgi:predicted nucleotidyltransferase